MASILDFSGDPKKKYGAVSKKDTIFISDPQEYKLRKQAFADSSYAFNNLSTTLSPQKQYQDVKNAQVEGAEVPYRKPKDLTDLDKKKLLKSGAGYKGIAPVKVMKYDEKADERNFQKGLESSVYIVKDNVIAENPWYKDPTQVPVFQEKPEYVDPFTIAAKKIQEIPIDAKSRVLDLPDINYINQQEAIMDEPFMESYSPQMSKPSGAAIQGQRRPDYGRQIRNAAGEKSTRAKLIDLVYDEEGNVKNKSLYGKYKNEIAKMNADENYLMNLAPLPDGNLTDADFNKNKVPIPAKQEVNKQLTPDELTTKMGDDIIPTGLTGKDFEKWIRNTGDDGISAYFEALYNKRKASGEKITEEDYKGVKQQILEYINSPLFAERQANLPEDYGLSKEDRKSPNAEQFLKQFNQEAHDWKKKKRIELLSEVGIKLDEPKERTGHYVPSQLPSNIELSTPYTRAVIAHELGHAMHDFKAPLTDEQKAYMKENKGELPRDKQLSYKPDASDSYNAYNFYKYGNEEKGSGAQFANPKLNLAEADMFQRLAKPLLLTSDRARYREEDPSKPLSDPNQMEIRAFNKRVDEYKRKMQKHYSKDEHIDKDSSDKFEFADEMYGDLQGVRQLLLDSGITKSFGEELDKDKMNKAILDKNVTDDPVFRRFYYRYGKDNIIKLNNTIAKNNSKNKGKSLMDIASA